VKLTSASWQRGLVMARQYVSDAGDVVWISFNPQARRAKRKGRISDAELAELRRELRGLIG